MTAGRASTDATDGQAWDLDQTRLHNKANEIDTDDVHGAADEGAVTESAGPEWAGPEYDPDGNLVGGPQPGAETVESEVS